MLSNARHWGQKSDSARHTQSWTNAPNRLFLNGVRLSLFFFSFLPRVYSISDLPDLNVTPLQLTTCLFCCCCLLLFLFYFYFIFCFSSFTLRPKSTNLRQFPSSVVIQSSPRQSSPISFSTPPVFITLNNRSSLSNRFEPSSSICISLSARVYIPAISPGVHPVHQLSCHRQRSS